MSINIRHLRDEEIPEALSLSWDVFSVYESPVYSKEGTEEFRKALHDEEYLKGIVYYGAFFSKKLVGVLGIRKDKCHICFFFVDGDYQRQGIGTKLFLTMKNDFQNCSITLNSSPYGLPFYQSLGFRKVSNEMTVNGICFTPMIYLDPDAEYPVICLKEHPEWKERAAEWFASKWSVPKEAYLESIEESMHAVVPNWYLCLNGERIAGGLGVIENDFHNRKDLSPNVCAVYTDLYFRRQGIAGKLLNHVCEDMEKQGIHTLYLLTDHTGFYERYGWEFLCMVRGNGEDEDSRMYIHTAK